MGTLLRLAGASLFVATLFLPSLSGCGLRLDQAGLASDSGAWGAVGLLLAAIAFGLFAFLDALLTRTPAPARDGWIALLAAAFAAAAILFFNSARAKGARVLGAGQAQLVALAAILVGSILRLCRSRKSRS